MNLENQRKVDELLARCAAMRRRLTVLRLELAERELRRRVPPKDLNRG